MNDPSPDLDLSTSADATRGPLSRRTLLAGSAFAVPAIALTTSTPASAASTDWDLTISYVAIDSGTPKEGLPGHNAGDNLFIDATAYNAGQGASPQTQLVFDFDANYVSSVAAYPGWVEVSKATTNGRFISTMQYSGGGLAAKASAAGRWYFQLRADAPSGSNVTAIGVSARPTAGDADPSNNNVTKSLYCTQSRTSDLTFTYFALESDNLPITSDGRSQYSAGYRPFIDFSLKNVGDVRTPLTGIQFDFDLNYVKDVAAPSGWTISKSYTNGSRLVTVMDYSAGGLPTGQQAGGRVFYTIRDDAPGGSVKQTVTAVALPTAGDAMPANNTTSSTFYTYQAKKYDLAVSSLEPQTANVGTTNGRPTYGPDQSPFVLFAVKNSGNVASPTASIQIDFASATVAGATTPDGWSVRTSYFSGSRIVYVFDWSGGPLKPGQTATGGTIFKIQGDPPFGTNENTVNATALPTDGDASTGDNAKISTFYVYRAGGSGGSAPVNQNFDIQFADVSLPASHGGNTYNGYALFRPNIEGYTEFTIHNGGVGTVTNPTAVLSFPASQVADAYINDTTQWTKVAEWAENGRKGYRFRYSGSVAGGGQRSALCRVRFRTPSTVPGGTAPAKILMTAEPIQGDTFLTNNNAEQTYYTIA